MPPPKRKPLWVRLAVRLVPVVIIGLAISGFFIATDRWSPERHRRLADQAINRYLNLVRLGDWERAKLMLCDGDQTPDAELFGGASWGGVVAYEIVSAQDRSPSPLPSPPSLSPGRQSQRDYHVQLEFAGGAVAVTDLVVRITGGQPCLATQIPSAGERQ